ncbi:MAG: putative DNA binding domain-containing protein, partial [Synergistaceae bacterium]|nr:putative DNA binding domain-containing protein [Synergistaceae bacterium]
EGVDLEFKTCRNQLNRDVYETVCAFLNRYGGTILLGVRDDGAVQGIEPIAAEAIRKDFVTAVNNPQKISPPTYLSVDEVMMEGKCLLRVYVPESSQVHRCNGRIYDRNEDGDLDITDHTVQVARLYQRKQAVYTENRVHPHIQLKDLRKDLIEKCRRYVRINKKDHPWSEMDDMELITSAQLYQLDAETGRKGVTLAGILLLGSDQLILSTCPAHRTDLILRKVNVDRYDDRDLVRTNLIDSYERIIAFVQKHLPDPFYLEGIERKSIRDAIFREVASNLIIHREFTSGVPARLIIEYGRVITYNANRPHGFGLLNPTTFSPCPKNPVVGAFFREIDRADELGSGMRNLMKYGKRYGGADPQLIEGDIFRMIVGVPEFGERLSEQLSNNGSESGPSQAQVRPKLNHDPNQSNAQLGPGQSQVKPGPGPSQVRPESEEASKGELSRVHLLTALRTGPLSKAELAAALGHKSVSGMLKTHIRKLLAEELIEYTISDKPSSRLQKYRLTAKGEEWI